MDNQIFRKKSLERIASPEQLNDYMRVTNPPVWIVLGAVILLRAGLLIWSGFAVIESKAAGTAVVSGGEATVRFDDETAAARVETGMAVRIGEVSAPITFVGRDQDGSVVAGAQADLPDGEYECQVTYKLTRVLEMLFE